jgi:lysophospholipase L1-like esterase
MLRILALGDSYTIGEGVLPEQRWPVQLAERLRARGASVECPVILARTGWTTDELLAAIHEETASNRLSGSFDLVTLLIGVNNQYRGRELGEYRLQFNDLLYQATAFAGHRPGRVLVLSIPDWSVTPFAERDEYWNPLRAQVAAQIDEFNLGNRAGCEQAGARYVDITPLTRQQGHNAEWLASDGLHPSGKMYAAWVVLALSTVDDLLSTG